MSNYWIGLLANFGLLVIIMSVWVQTREWLVRRPLGWIAPLSGGILGLGAVGLMLLPFEVQEGVFVDLRQTMIALSAFFGGPVSGLVTVAVASAYRLHEGGVGAPAGVVGISIVYIVGVASHFFAARRHSKTLPIVLLALGTSVGSLLSFLFLPTEIWTRVLPVLGPPISVLLFVSTVLAALVIHGEARRREVSQALQTHHAIMNALPDCLNAKDLQGRFLAANPATSRLMGASGAMALIGRTDFDFYTAETAARFREDEVRLVTSGQPFTIEQLIQDADGRKIWLSTLKAPFRDAAGTLMGVITHNRDITDRKRLEEELAESRMRLSAALSYMADALVMFDRQRRLVYCNEQYRSLFPITADLRVPGTPLVDILRAAVERGEEAIAEGDVEAWIERMCETLDAAGDRQIQLGDGRWLEARIRPVGDGSCLIVFSDVTAATHAQASLVELNERLKVVARTDGLTGLVNRRAFDEALEREMARAARSGLPLSLLMIDVDRFKAYNDVYGHPGGDKCLQAIAHCLKSHLRRPADVAARYGGEEFAAILPETGEAAARDIAERFRAAVRERAWPHEASELGVVTISCGVANMSAGDAPRQPEEFVRHADEALYAAKASGRDRVLGRADLLDIEHPRFAKTAG